jgi:hypothetical protein
VSESPTTARDRGVLEPQTIEAAAELLAGVWSSGNRTVVVDRPEMPSTCDSDVVPVSLRTLRRITRVDPSNLAVITEAGVTIGALRETVSELGLWCPALRWLPADETMGAAVAGGHGRRSRRYGAVADYLLGTRFICPSVGLVRHGGLAIKNATGYNLTGSVAGSRGRLAVIVEVILRLLPRPGNWVIRQFRTSESGAPGSDFRDILSAGPNRDLSRSFGSSLSAAELWCSGVSRELKLLVETEGTRQGSGSLAGFECIPDSTGIESSPSATVNWPPKDVLAERQMVRLGVEPAAVWETVGVLRADSPSNPAIGSILAEVTGGALDISVADIPTASRIRGLCEHRPSSAGREQLQRALKQAFDPTSLLIENPPFAISNGLSP